MNEMLQSTFDFTLFYWATVICLGIGVLSAIRKQSVDRIMSETEEKASGHSVH